MGLRFSILTILLGIAWTTGPYFYKGHTGCRQCHSPHYENWGRCVDCHLGDSRTLRIQIAHFKLIQGEYACFTLPESPDVEKGRRLIKKFGCRRCHKTGNEGNTLASDLDSSLKKTAAEDLAISIKNPATFMPNFHFQEADVTRLVNAILDSSAVYASTAGGDIRVIHFEEDIKDDDNIFNKRCDPCHRVLTRQLGGLGRGDIGPNLSGLFSKYYFQSFKEGKSWNADRLKQWLKNPRDIRVNTQMLPMQLTQDEMADLIAVLTS